MRLQGDTLNPHWSCTSSFAQHSREASTQRIEAVPSASHCFGGDLPSPAYKLPEPPD